MQEAAAMTVTTAAAPLPATISDHPAHHHPGHKLKRVENDDDGRQSFICDGCLERGAGARYSCEHEGCKFELHSCCAVAPYVPTLTLFLFGNDRVFLFLQKPEPPPPTTTTGTAAGDGINGSFRVCIACVKTVCGFVYHCFDDGGGDGVGGIDLHPSCARMPDLALLINDQQDVLLSFQREEQPRPRGNSSGMSSANDDDHWRGGGIRRQPPPARHRQPAGAGGRQAAGAQDPPPPPENSRRVIFFEDRHQVAPRPAATSDDDRDRRQQDRQPPAGRHRCWAVETRQPHGAASPVRI